MYLKIETTVKGKSTTTILSPGLMNISVFLLLIFQKVTFQAQLIQFMFVIHICVVMILFFVLFVCLTFSIIISIFTQTSKIVSCDQDWDSFTLVHHPP